MVMDLIIIGVGLTVLLTRDIYRVIKRKRRNRKLKKRLAESGGLIYACDSAYNPADPTSLSASGVPVNTRGMGVPIPAPRTSRNHPDRPVTLPGRRRRRGWFHRSRTEGGVDNCNGDAGDWRDYGAGEEYCVERMGTPPPAYSPPSSASSEFRGATLAGAGGGVGDGVPVEPPPPFEHHAHTSDGAGEAAKVQRRAEVMEILMEYGHEQEEGRGISRA